MNRICLNKLLTRFPLLLVLNPVTRRLYTDACRSNQHMGSKQVSRAASTTDGSNQFVTSIVTCHDWIEGNNFFYSNFIQGHINH